MIDMMNLVYEISNSIDRIFKCDFNKIWGISGTFRTITSLPQDYCWDSSSNVAQKFSRNLMARTGNGIFVNGSLLYVDLMSDICIHAS